MTTQTTAAPDVTGWAHRPQGPSTDETIARVDAWWRAADHLPVGRVHLLEHPLPREPLATGHLEPRLPGRRGTTPGLRVHDAHLDRAVRDRVRPDAGGTGRESSGTTDTGRGAGTTTTGGDHE